MTTVNMFSKHEMGSEWFCFTKNKKEELPMKKILATVGILFSSVGLLLYFLGVNLIFSNFTPEQAASLLAILGGSMFLLAGALIALFLNIK